MLGVWGFLSNYLFSSIKNTYETIACRSSPVPPLNWGYSGGSGGICGGSHQNSPRQPLPTLPTSRAGCARSAPSRTQPSPPPAAVNPFPSVASPPRRLRRPPLAPAPPARALDAPIPASPANPPAPCSHQPRFCHRKPVGRVNRPKMTETTSRSLNLTKPRRIRSASDPTGPAGPHHAGQPAPDLPRPDRACSKIIPHQKRRIILPLLPSGSGSRQTSGTYITHPCRAPACLPTAVIPRRWPPPGASSPPAAPAS